MVVYDRYLKKYSRNQIQTWCVHILGECLELICFLATLAKFWPSSGHKMPENGGFRPLSGKVFTQSISNLLCTLMWWVFRIDLLLGHIGQNHWTNFDSLVATKWLKIVVSNHYLKKYQYVEGWLHNLFQTWCSQWLEGSSQIGRMGLI